MRSVSNAIDGQLDLLGNIQPAPSAVPLAAVSPSNAQSGFAARAQFEAELARSWQFADAFLDVLDSEPVLLAGGALEQVRASLKRASMESDLRQATDYDVQIRVASAGWAIRVRRHRYLRPFGDHIILRADRTDGHPSEADKILHDPDSAARYLAAWASPDDTGFSQWIACDLDRLRRVYADPERRQLLSPSLVSLAGSSVGLKLPIKALIAQRVVIRAVLATRSFASKREAREFLRRCKVLAQYSPAELNEVAEFMYENALDTRRYIGADPL
ncbi:MAG: hypothetical protein ACOYEV_10410 [Candidatus Nanopelagicales bacterium]